MKLSSAALWQRFQEYYFEYPTIGLALDLSRMNFPDGFFETLEPRLQSAYREMRELEGGAIANRDENRMVGHYWLRNPSLAPTPVIRLQIEDTIAAIKQFALEVHQGSVRSVDGAFKNLLVIGIGGSALGPQFVTRALGHPAVDKLKVFFFDNTDPDGMDRVIAEIGDELAVTMTLVISKSGGTKETRNGMLEARAAYQRRGLNFEAQAVAITGAGSELAKLAQQEAWLRTFPMWDWVGGRTSELSAVGLLPAALQGYDIDSLLAGARACDELTRTNGTKSNPAALLAASWWSSGNGKGSKDMVVLPYKDRLDLFSRYLQQLVMESLGKRRDRSGNEVFQGIAVYGNKGSTDQHAYIQQLRDGLNNFFVTFVEVLHEREGEVYSVEPGVTSGDYLAGFFLGTRQALFDSQRESITITISSVSAFSVGVLIALFERSVGIYAALIDVNAYNQPGVEAGKKAAEVVIEIQSMILDYLNRQQGCAFTATEIAASICRTEHVETIFKTCNRLTFREGKGKISRIDGVSPFQARFGSLS